MRIFEVDDIRGRDLGSVQGNVIVEHFGPRHPLERLRANALGHAPNLFAHLRCRRIGVLLHLQHRPLGMAQVEQGPGFVLELARISRLRVVGGEVFGAEEVFVAAKLARLEDVFFAVEEHEIDADFALEPLHVVAEFHHHGHAAGTVVCTHKRLRPVAAILLLIGNGSRVVVGANQDAAFLLGMPRDHEVRHVGVGFAAHLPGLELLSRHRRAQILEVLLDDLLLLLHAVGAADARADVAELLEVLERPLGVELHVHRGDDLRRRIFGELGLLGQIGAR